ncbi:MAG: bifunctional 23S rRNA (guanine(2069)-N(7))-methyltransferase RlmK/23S rRNA (guanine(2445)-N(2))-methyltransferase RlmL [Gammaproteobacteria bacterium]
MTMTYRYFATAARGTGFLLADELRALGLQQVRESGAGVTFAGNLADGYRACLWSRLASRILCELGEFPAADADQLYAGVSALDWPALHQPGASIAVQVTGTTKTLTNSHFSALKVKDAVVDSLRAARDERPSVDAKDPDLALFVRLRDERATLSFDLAGRPLHRRGYRREAGEAPLRETLAAALLVRAGWPAVAAAGGALLDPMCGAGTLPIEAALMASDTAPGLLWGTAGPRGWAGHDRKIWHGLMVEAADRHEAGLAQLPVMVGRDRDEKVIEIAKRNAAVAGFADHILFEVGTVESTEPPAESGLMVTNPPYGERLAHDAMLVPLYAALGRRLRDEFPGWRMAILTPTPELGFHLGMRSHRQTRFDNGPIECQLLEFEVHRHAEGRAAATPPADDFANRLRKNAKNLAKWAKREGIECYRVYDADLPEYALAIDLYGAFVHLQEYAPPKTIDPVKARTRLDGALAVLPEVLGIDPSNVFLKQRKRGKGGERYGKLAEHGRFHQVSEGPARFWVNFTEHLDTGLFLDHRPLRAAIRQQAKGKSFLNLFCYTASATVHAALGGAVSSTSVDMSRTYLDWARRNFLLNGVDDSRHELVQADALVWMKASTARYDLVLLDPPTFSSSKRMEGVLDVQRDHVALIEDALKCTAAGGTLLFSTNYQGFKLDADALAHLSVEDISAQMLPEDFKRRPKIHRVWRIRPTT